MHERMRVKKQVTPCYYYEKSIELIHPLKGSQRPPGVPGSHFESLRYRERAPKSSRENLTTLKYVPQQSPEDTYFTKVLRNISGEEHKNILKVLKWLLYVGCGY